MNNIQRARNIVTCPVDVEITIRDAQAKRRRYGSSVASADASRGALARKAV